MHDVGILTVPGPFLHCDPGPSWEDISTHPAAKLASLQDLFSGGILTSSYKKKNFLGDSGTLDACASSSSIRLALG